MAPYIANVELVHECRKLLTFSAMQMFCLSVFNETSSILLFAVFILIYLFLIQVAVCNLASVAVNMFVRTDKTYDFQKLKYVTKVGGGRFYTRFHAGSINSTVIYYIYFLP